MRFILLCSAWDSGILPLYPNESSRYLQEASQFLFYATIFFNCISESNAIFQKDIFSLDTVANEWNHTQTVEIFQ